MNDTIENLNINVKFNDNLGDAATRLNELADSINKVNSAAGKTSAIGRMGKQVESLNDKTSKLKTSSVFKEIGESSKKASESTKGFIGSMSTAIVKVAVFMRALRTLSKFVLKGITDLNKLSLGIAHINTLFGEGADEVIRYARSVEKLMGIPMADFLSTQGTLGNMLSGFGVANEKVKDMSQSLTQLSFDLEAFNSLGLNQQQLLGMMQSGLSGYDKSLRRLGFALREVELQEILNRNGLAVKVSELNRAGKSQLVYMAIMEQSAKMGAMGALGRQTQSPIVAFNMLKNQTRILAQTLAGALLPVIMKTIKFLHALAMAATNVVVRIAALFGVQIQPIDFGGAMGGVSDYVDGLEDIADNASGATKKIKELRDQMAGFDKLNVMKQEAPSTPSGGAGVGGLGGLDLDIPMPKYGDFLTNMTKDVEALAKVLEPILIILGAIAAFKLGGWLLNIPIIAKFLGAISGVISLWGVWVAEMGVVKGTLSLLGSALTSILTPMTLMIAGIAAVVVAIVQLWKENERFRDNVKGVWESIKNIVTSVWENMLKPTFEIIGTHLMWIVDYALVPLWEKFKMVFESVANLVMTIWNEALGPIVQWLVDTFGAIIPIAFGIFAAVFTGVFIAVSKVFEVAMWAIAKGVDVITLIFQELIKLVKKLFNADWGEIWDKTKKIFGNIWDGIKSILKWFKDGFMNTFNAVIGFVGNFLKLIGVDFDAVKGVFTNIIGFIKNVFTGQWKAAFENVIGIFKNLFGSIGGIFKQAWDGILVLLTAGGKIFSGVVKGIANIFATLVNSIIRGINNVIATPFNLVNSMMNKIKSISILGAKPFNKFWGTNPIPIPKIPTIPSYDVGTSHVTHDHIAQIHKGEAIIPEKFNDKKYFGQQNDEETKKLLKEQNRLLMKILEKDSTVRVSSSDIESAGNNYRRMLVKAKGGA